jgi:hypothetical protein
MPQERESGLSDLERLLLEMWERVLNLDGISREDNFFELGGDSIAAVRFTNMLQERLGEVVQVTLLYESPTIARLSEYLVESYRDAVSVVLGWPVAGSKELDGPQLTEKDVAYVSERYSALYQFPDNGHSDTLDREAERRWRKNLSPVFILSPPRSGSTLLRVMLAGHRNLFAPPELILLQFHSLKQRNEKYSGDRGVWSEGVIRAIMEARRCDATQAREALKQCEEKDLTIREFYALMQEWISDRRLVDKSPSYARSKKILQRAEDYFEEAAYIHLVRHPAAMIRSYEAQRLDQLSLSERLGYDTRKLAELIWIVSHRNILDFLKDVPKERQCRVVFENLVKEPRNIIEKLCDFLKLEFDEEVLAPYENQAGKMTDGPHPLSRMLGDAKFHTHKNIDPAVADAWKCMERPPALSEITLRLAEELGY